MRDLPGSPVLQEVAKPFLEYWEHVRAVLARGWNVRGRKRKLLHAAIGLRGRAVRLDRVRLAGVLVVALALAGVAAAADGGSGTYTSSADTYDFNLFNAGTTIWQYFVLIGPDELRGWCECRRGDSLAASSVSRTVSPTRSSAARSLRA